MFDLKTRQSPSISLLFVNQLEYFAIRYLDGWTRAVNSDNINCFTVLRTIKRLSFFQLVRRMEALLNPLMSAAINCYNVFITNKKPMLLKSSLTEWDKLNNNKSSYIPYSRPLIADATSSQSPLSQFRKSWKKAPLIAHLWLLSPEFSSLTLWSWKIFA